MKTFSIFSLIVLLSWNQIAKAENPVSRYIFEDGRCKKAVDILDGRPLRWHSVNLSECGFDMSKPSRLDSEMVGGKCRHIEVYTSKLRYGEIRKYLGPKGDLALEKCGYINEGRIEYQLRNGSCQKVKIQTSTIAAMPEHVTLLDIKGSSMENCGFKPENEVTDYELRSGKCYKIFVNKNDKGERTVKISLKEEDPKACGIDLKASPAAITYSPQKGLSSGVFPSIVDKCFLVKTYVSSTGKGIYETFDSLDVEACNRSDTGGTVTPPPTTR